MAAHRTTGKERSTRTQSQAVESPSRTRTRSVRCERSTCTSPKAPRAKLHLRSRRERRATAQSQPTRKLLISYQKFQTRRVWALAACQQFANRVAVRCSRANGSPALIHARQCAAPTAGLLLKKRPRKQNPAAAE